MARAKEQPLRKVRIKVSMNIFATSLSPRECAEALCDQHVIKMTLETAQILCTVTGEGPYKPTHQNHPCTLWAAKISANLDWLINHGIALGEEYTYRFGKEHASASVIEDLRSSVYKGFVVHPTPFAQCVPEAYVSPDPCEAYKLYLASKSEEWKNPMRYTRRLPPGWLKRVKWRAHHTEKW